VKFIRFAQWKIDHEGQGVLGFITNHSYLDNPTFRGMRQSLMQSFDEMYILDLHGNSLKKEKSPDGSKDENVFDIQQGVAIAIFIKKTPLAFPLGKVGIKGGSKVFHSELWGLREKKYDWLNTHDVTTTKWKKISPKSEYYLFFPRDEKLLSVYERYMKITDIFPVNSVGIVTSRDDFVIDFDRDKLRRRILQFRDKKLPDEIIQQAFELRDKSNWELKNTRKSIMKDDEWEKVITKILYRPFDERWIFYHEAVLERSRTEVMRHMIKDNIGLITVRQVAEGNFSHVFVSDSIVESRITLSNKGIGFLFPLYLYIDANKPSKKKTFGLMLFEPKASYFVKKPNINETLLKNLAASYAKQPSPEKIFYYIYAVLHRL
jgi:predicted helicase